MNAIAYLRQFPHWVAWRHEQRNGRWTKPPISPRHGDRASVSKPSEWTTFDDASAFAEDKGLPGVGFVLTANDDITGIDLDRCRDAKTGLLDDWAAEIIALGETYAEVSPSGTGLRLIARGKVGKTTKCDAAHVEIYRDGRYLTITGDRLEGAPDEINEAPHTLELLLARVATFASLPVVEMASEPGVITAASPVLHAKDRFRQVNDAALADLAAWVPQIFPRARHQPGTGAWRVSSRDLGRDREEDLSLAPNGIVDWGEHDMGDAHAGKRTPIDIVMEWGGAPNAGAAGEWLALQLGVEFERPVNRDIKNAAEGIVAAAALLKSAERPDNSRGPELQTVSASSLAGHSPPPRQFLAPGLIPAADVTILSGNGGDGKSLLATQLLASVASGALWLGMQVQRGRALYLSAEDDIDEVHRRLAAICEAEGIDLGALRDLFIAPLAGEETILAAETRTGGIAATPLWRELVEKVADIKVTLLVIDTLADVFDGDEIARRQARQFVRMLRGLAMKKECTILLLSHPSQSGMASGSGSSGNTAWHNSARARLYLTRPISPDGEPGDPDVRILQTKKMNYGPMSDEIRLRWTEGRFINEEPKPQSAFDGIAADAKAERIFMDILVKLTKQGRDVSPKPSQSYAPAVFEKHPDAVGIRKRKFADAMERLLEAGRIEVETSGPPSRRTTRLVVCERHAYA